MPQDLVGNPERWKYMREKGLQTSPPVLTPHIHPRNVALSSLKKRKDAEEKESQGRENNLFLKKETPVVWKKAKTHKHKRKQQRLQKRLALEDWQSLSCFIFIVMKRKTKQTKKKKTKQNKLLDQAYCTKRPSVYSGGGALKRATKLKQSDVINWLSRAYTLHNPVRRAFRRRRILVGGIDHQWQADLTDVQRLKKDNDGWMFH